MHTHNLTSSVTSPWTPAPSPVSTVGALAEVTGLALVSRTHGKQMVEPWVQCQGSLGGPI